MAKFVETNYGTFENLDHVRYFRTEKNKHGVYVLVAYPDDDNRSPSECGTLRYVADALFPIIPAQPGFALLSVYFYNMEAKVPDNIAEWINSDIIIAWRMRGWPEPITVENHENADVQAVLSPDGQINIPDDISFANRDGFIEYVRSRWQAHWDELAETTKKEAARK